MARHAMLALLLALLAGCHPATAAEPDPWEKLNLKSTEIAGTVVYYEKVFEPNLPFFEKNCQAFLKVAEDNKKETLHNKDQIIARINSILGIADAKTEAQRRMLDDLSRPLPFPKPTFFLITEATVKDFLRVGGELPGFKYDNTTDTAEYYLDLWWRSKTDAEKGPQFAFPLKSEAEFEQMITKVFGVLTKFASTALTTGMKGGAIHEVVEASLLSRVKPQGPYWRWFSDGFANAIALQILEELVSEQSAAEFAKAFDPNDHKHLERDLNLRYWMAAKYCVLPIGGPIDYEGNFTEARYTYATLEARRLIDKHGLDLVDKILEEICDKESRTGEDLCRAITKVTGEDMSKRLDRYQTFASRLEGITKYKVPFDNASRNKDYEQMLINLLRLMELHEFQYSHEGLQNWHNAAGLLFKLGHEDAGDLAMKSCMELFSGSPLPNGREAALEMFIAYAFTCGKPEKARAAAAELLKTRPDSVLALTVEMLAKVGSGNISEAKQMAKKIQSLTKSKETVSYRAASQVLAIEPNQPPPQH